MSSVFTEEQSSVVKTTFNREVLVFSLRFKEGKMYKDH